MGYGANAASVPTIRSSTTSGLTTAVRTAQPGTSHGSSPRPKDWVRPFSTVVATSALTWPSWCAPSPSHARQPAVSVTASAGVPSRSRRCRTARSALALVSPSRSAGEASDAVCSVRKVARSASDPRCVRRHTRMGTA